jgi:xanthine dehydrogenase small subunit
LIKFILNNKDISTPLPPGMVLLDFIRYHQHLHGTKIGCNEGDCGACTVLVGEWQNNALQYRSYTACLTPLGNAHGKHIVTIEGLNNSEGLNPVQQAMCDESATQCGFCTPGFTVSLAGFCLNSASPTAQHAIAAVDGNICRCTGYKSIERAAARVALLLQNREDKDPVGFATANQLLPGWFNTIGPRLQQLKLSLNGNGLYPGNDTPARIVGGGTDLYVQKHDEMHDAAIRFVLDDPKLKDIVQQGDRCIIGPAATVTDMKESPVFRQYFPRFAQHAALVSSTPIRNIATVAGNFINASPIGDFTIFFLALDAMLVLSDGATTRELPLRHLYKGYKTLDKKPSEYIEKIWFKLPGQNSRFSFEKVSKRTNLDIASVNTAMHIVTDGNTIQEAHLSAGGVGPIPKFLEKTSAFLKGRPPEEDTIRQAAAMAQLEITPISDARGSETYKRLLLSQLIKAHFITLFPELKAETII